ncbi:hypothetical protein BH11PSE4_BH11PSE4_12190 [soil metagenome]
MGLDHVRNEIERMRLQIRRQRKEIQALARAGIATSSAEALLARMQDKVDGLVGERERLVGEARRNLPGKILKGTPESRRV